MRSSRLPATLTMAVLSLLALATSAQDAPQRKAGWWTMETHLPGGRVLTRNLCLDATSDARRNIFSAQPGCTMTAQHVAGGYAYTRACSGETTTGTAIGDFNSAYKIEESRGSAHVSTEARWMGPCPAGHAVDSLW